MFVKKYNNFYLNQCQCEKLNRWNDVTSLQVFVEWRTNRHKSPKIPKSL